ncbi:MAG: recombination protein O N-terminal domain-containing protein [Lentisphaeria bacterium]|nr:recombination protein O N-terminal domain-containing protein [Lentisphaeria bacterium]
MPESNCILLRLTPFRENTVIAASLSPEYGRLDLFLPGVKKTGKKQFPSVGLFRELAVDFKPPKDGSTLCTPRTIDIVRIHDSLVENTRNYMAVCSLAAFLLRNSRFMVELPRTYQALSVILARCAATKTDMTGFMPYVKLVFLHENGFVSVPPEKQKTLDSIFDFALGITSEPPPFNTSYYGRLIQWIDALVSLHCNQDG